MMARPFFSMLTLALLFCPLPAAVTAPPPAPSTPPCAASTPYFVTSRYNSDNFVSTTPLTLCIVLLWLSHIGASQIPTRQHGQHLSTLRNSISSVSKSKHIYLKVDVKVWRIRYAPEKRTFTLFKNWGSRAQKHLPRWLESRALLHGKTLVPLHLFFKLHR